MENQEFRGTPTKSEEPMKLDRHPSRECWSKIDLGPQLNPTRIVLTRSLAKAAIRQVRIHAVKVRPVKCVKEIEAQLKTDTLHNFGVLR